jgi:hypothetical protein
VLLKNFAANWASREKFFGPRWSSAAHAIRYFKYSSLGREEQVKHDDPNPEKFPIIRDRGIFQKTHKGVRTSLQEYRVSLALAFNGRHRFPCFTVITLADEDLVVPEKMMVGIRMDDSLKPFHVFLRIFDDTVEHVCKSWKDVIKGLDRELGVKVNGVQ